jgi:hypothetical protein
MFAIVRLMLALSPVTSSDIVCHEQPDPAACVEPVCRVMSGIDYDVAECDGLAEHTREFPPQSWVNRCPDMPDDCDVY